MPETVFGLPVHPLIVHATVVVVPVAAIAVALWFLSARFRAWAGALPLGLSLLAVVLAPLSTSSGENLEHLVGESALVRRHAELGDMLVWWCLGLFAVAAAGWLLRRSGSRRRVSAVLAAVALVVSAGTLVQTVLIGHSGAEAAWGDVAKQSASDHSDD